MKRTLCIAVLLMAAMACKETKKEPQQEMARPPVENENAKEGDSEWEVLFNGTSFAGWHEYAQEGVSQNWKIEEGAMVFYPPEDRKKGESYNLVTDGEFTDFELSLEWRIAEGGNSGVMWGVNEIPGLGQPYETGPEIQVLDNGKHPDGKNGTSHQAGALYDMVAPNKDVTRPAGQWNTMTIIIDHKENIGGVTLNGEQIVAFPVNDPEWSAMVADSKFADWEHFAKYTTGKIALQDHGDKVAYRNLKIRKL